MTVNAHFERYRLKLYPLSPIHVGSGNFIEPFEYDVETSGNVHTLEVYNLDLVLSQLTPQQRQEFERVSGGSFHNLRVWLRQQFRPEHRRFRLLLSNTAGSELTKTLDDRNRTGAIELLQRNPLTEQALLPGSSIKGAMRTAILDAVVHQSPPHRQQQLRKKAREVQYERKQRQQNRLEREFQATALDYAGRKNKFGSDLNYDPFRQLAISDFSIPQGQTYVERMQIVKRGGTVNSDPRKIQMYREVTQSYVPYRDAKQCFTSELRLFPNLADPQWAELGLSERFSWAEIARRCHSFYVPRFQQELRDHVTHQGVKTHLQAALELIGPHECLIRVGRHSHFECVTVDPAYTTVPRNGAGKTRTFADGLIPLGWAKLAAEPWTDQP